MKKINLNSAKKLLSREEMRSVSGGDGFPIVTCVCVYANGSHTTHHLYPPNCGPCEGICSGSVSWGCGGGSRPKN